MLIIVMVGAAATVMLTTQQDLSVAGQDREALESFYAAEYAVAQAKDYIASLTTVFWGGTGPGWTPLLSSGIVQLCAPSGSGSPPKTPGTQPQTTNVYSNAWSIPTAATGTNVFGIGTNSVQWAWCVHNDAEDINYIDSTKDTGGVTGDNNDANDNYHQIVIEGYGQIVPTGVTSPVPLAKAHVTVYIGPPGNAPTVAANCYSQGQGCGTKAANAGVSEQNVTVVTAGAQTNQRGL